MAKKQIFLVYACDLWKGRDSMRLVMASSSAAKTKRFISKQIEEDKMEYDRLGDRPPREEALIFRKDWDSLTRRELNSNLRYGFYDYVYDGEEI